MVTSEDYERLLNLLRKHANSDEYKEYLKKQKIKNEIKLNRFRRFERYLETHSFDELLNRLILEHGDEWHKKCAEKGVETHMNNKLKFLFDYIINNANILVDVNELKCNFPNQIWEFKEYYFQMIWGQGVILKIFNKDGMKEILSI